MPNNYFSKLTSPDFWKKRPFWLGFLLLAIVVIVVSVVVKSALKIPAPEQIEIDKQLSQERPEVLLLTSGKQTYEILTDRPKSFMIIQVELDPFDVRQGRTQIVTVQVKDTENRPITQEDKVEAIVYTDNISTPFSLSLKKVEDSNSGNILTWQGSWELWDTNDSKYMMSIKAKSVGSEHSIDLSFR